MKKKRSRITKMDMEAALQSKSLTQKAFIHIRKDRVTLAAIGIIIFLAVLSASAPVITGLLGVDPNTTDASSSKFLPVGSEGHLLGTDNLGRDHLSRLLYAGQVSLLIGFLSGILSLVVGVSLGILTGFYGGLIDDLIHWVITIIIAIPALVFLIVVSSIFSPDPLTLILTLVFFIWPSITRLVRGETLSIRSREYIVSAQAAGASNARIMWAHILPNVFSITIVTLAINTGTVILIESSLSFLGHGVQPPIASWGNMLSKSREFFKVAGHLVIFPGVLITIVVLCLYLIGDGLRDAFDPTSQN